MKQEDKKKLDRLKQEYRNIPVPKDARNRALAGIEAAKREKRRNNMIKFTKRTGMTAAAAMLTITVMTNLSPVTANAMEQIPVIGSIAKVVTFRTFEDAGQNHEAKIDVPQVSIAGKENTAVNKSIEDYANELIAEYEQEAAASQDGDGHYSVSSTYEVVTDTERYLSLRINTTVIMASGAGSVKIYTIDKTTGEVITLSGLFKDKPDTLTAISDNIKKQMTGQMAADESKLYFYQSGEEAAEDFKGLTGEESFYFNEDGLLVIVFDEYTVAPGYMGVVEFTIPEDIAGKF